MNREEAKQKFIEASPIPDLDIVDTWLNRFEALGILKFDEEKHIGKNYQFTIPELGTVKFEQWPEGWVVWVGGEIRYKSWKDNNSASKELAVSYCMKTCYTTGNFIRQLEQMGFKIIKT